MTTDQTLFPENYEAVKLIGSGGMGSVYCAVDRQFARTVAIKVLNTGAFSPDQLLRFQREAQALSKLDHPNIVRALALGRTPSEQPYIVMEYVEGHDLGEILESKRRLEVTRAVELFKQIASALAYLHNAGLVHRDIKPSNVLVTTDGAGNEICKLVDFGIAFDIDAQKLTATGHILGSLAYSSPEQLTGQKVDERTDIYSMGVLMYQALTGDLPFDPQNILAIAQADSSFVMKPAKQLRPEIGDGLDRIVMRSLSKDISERIANGADLLEALNRGDITWSKAPRAVPRVKKKLPVVVFAVVAIAMLCGIGWMFLRHDATEVSKQLKEQQWQEAQALFIRGYGDNDYPSRLRKFKAAYELARSSMADTDTDRERIMQMAAEIARVQHDEHLFTDALEMLAGAEKMFRNDFPSKSTRFKIYFGKALCYGGLGQTESYKRWLLEAEKFHERDNAPSIDWALGNIYFTQNKFADAKKYLLNAMKEMPAAERESDQFWQISHQCADAQCYLGEYQQALDSAQQAKKVAEILGEQDKISASNAQIKLIKDELAKKKGAQ